MKVYTVLGLVNLASLFSKSEQAQNAGYRRKGSTPIHFRLLPKPEPEEDMIPKLSDIKRALRNEAYIFAQVFPKIADRLIHPPPPQRKMTYTF